MAINASWDKSATQYVEMYRYGQLVKQWKAKRQEWIASFADSLQGEQTLFADFFAPGYQEYSDWFDWELKRFLNQLPR